MRNLGIARAAKSMVPKPARKRIHDRLSAWAANRVLEEIIAKTDDMRTVRWVGHTIWQHPADAWLIQEAISEQRPDLIVETGTFMGGSAYFFSMICDQLDHGEIVSIDIDAKQTIPHPRITYLSGSSVAPEIVQTVRERAAGAERLLVILDSDHSAAHVLAELEAYAPLIPVGCYIHVQDGLIDESPVFGYPEPGPATAVRQFLAKNPAFVRDVDFEQRYVVTAHPLGWLKRVS